MYSSPTLLSWRLAPSLDMRRVDPFHRRRLLNRLDARQVDGHGLGVAAHEDAFEDLVGTGVDLLVRHVGRHVYEVAGAGLGGELELLAPAHARAALEDVDDGLEVAVVVRARLGVGMDVHRPGPDLLRPHAREVDRRGAVHARRRVRIRIERPARDHAHAFVLPAVAWSGMRVCIGRCVCAAGGGHDADLDTERVYVYADDWRIKNTSLREWRRAVTLPGSESACPLAVDW